MRKRTVVFRYIYAVSLSAGFPAAFLTDSAYRLRRSLSGNASGNKEREHARALALLEDRPGLSRANMFSR